MGIFFGMEKSLGLKDKNLKILKISKEFLKPLIRLSDLKDSSYCISKIEKVKKEDYVLWVNDIENVEDKGTKDYLKWAEKFIIEENNFKKNKK